MLGTTNQIDPLKLHFETIPNQKSKLLLYIFNPRINLVVPAFLAVNVIHFFFQKKNLKVFFEGLSDCK